MVFSSLCAGNVIMRRRNPFFPDRLGRNAKLWVHNRLWPELKRQATALSGSFHTLKCRFNEDNMGELFCQRSMGAVFEAMAHTSRFDK